MDRQHSSPIVIRTDGSSLMLKPVPQQGPLAKLPEKAIQALVHDHPSALPVAEIDPMFLGAVAVCQELQLGQAGRVDNFLVTPSGLPILVECKLWRNPEARRAVVGQILDYAKVLSRWSFSDVQREVSRHTGKGPTALLDLVRAADPHVDEAQFADALTVNLRRGRFLLLILGDGVREDVEAIASYLQDHAGLHFTFGLVEFPIYDLPNGERLVAPRVVVRTTSIVRTVIETPDNYMVQATSELADNAEKDPNRAAVGDSLQAFWSEFLAGVHLDDRAQPLPKPARLEYLGFMLPAPGGSSWLTVYRKLHRGEVGVFLSAHRGSPGEDAMNVILADWKDVKAELGGTTRVIDDPYQRKRIIDSKSVGDLNNPGLRKEAFAWLAERVNTFVDVLRPRVRDAVEDSVARAD